MPSKRKCLTLEERISVLKQLESGKSCRSIAAELGVGKTQIQSVQKRKREIEEEYERDGSSEAKRPRRTTEYEDINELLHKWFLDATARHVNVSGPLLKERALKFAAELGVSSFKASNGWLESFIKRHNIVFKTRSGERAEVNLDVVQEWRKRLGPICEEYRPEDVFNMDETGLFYKQSTKSTYFQKGETCAGGKKSKDRITIGLCSSATGEKLPPIVIGKSKKPRCFGTLTPDKLPIKYYNNAKAWMTSGIMEDWLRWLDRKMKKANRKILLFLDNAPSHPRISLTNVQLQFLPPNTTSVCQPMDQGIIQTMKLKYRKRQLQHVIMEMERSSSSTGPQILKDITILQAIYWVIGAWKDTSSETISKCFVNCGFSVSDGCESDSVVGSDSGDDDEDELPLIMHKLARDLFGCEVRELMKIDQDFSTCDSDMSTWDRPALEILCAQKDNESESDTEETADDEQQKERPLTSLADICDMSAKIQSWAIEHGHENVIHISMELRSAIGNVAMVGDSLKQKKISDFFT